MRERARGRRPEADPRDPRGEELRRFTATLGRAGWWTALGRDAATLARRALLALPVDTVGDVARRGGPARGGAREPGVDARAPLDDRVERMGTASRP